MSSRASGAEVGEPLVSHPKVAHVGFTGGEAAGRRVYELAARGLKTVTLELGGKSPNIVFDDADLDQAVKGVVSGIFAASGQSCQAGSRLLVQRSIHDAFVDKLVAFVKTAKLGDPAPPDTQIGPIATRPQFEKILNYIRIATEEGARCVLGGKSRPDLGAGLFIEPTILTDVRNQHAHRAGGSVRARARGHPVRRRAGSDRDRQRRRVWPRPRASGRRVFAARC